jgi:hypothetical protein
MMLSARLAIHRSNSADRTSMSATTPHVVYDRQTQVPLQY